MRDSSKEKKSVQTCTTLLEEQRGARPTKGKSEQNKAKGFQKATEKNKANSQKANSQKGNQGKSERHQTE